MNYDHTGNPSVDEAHWVILTTPPVAPTLKPPRVSHRKDVIQTPPEYPRSLIPGRPGRRSSQNFMTFGPTVRNKGNRSAATL